MNGCLPSESHRRIRLPTWLLLFVACALLASPNAHPAPITFNTALPVSQNELILREQIVVSESAALRQQTLNTVIGYGVTPKLAVFGVLPVTRRDAVGGDTEIGIADATLFARYEVFRQDNAGATLRVAPFLGVRLPSAAPDVLGDNGTDALLGIIATSASTKRVVDAQVAVELNGDAAGGRTGHLARFDASLQYRAWPQTLTRRTKGFVYAVIESSLTYQERSRREGLRLPDTGGLQWFLIPGLQYVRQRWIADLAVKIPVVSNLNGEAFELDYSVFASVRFNF